MLRINDAEIRQLEDDLNRFAERAYPFATKQTLNRSAFDARKRAQANIRDNMVTRNRFTVSSVRVEKARTLNVNRQEALTGSIAEYLETQEFGGMERGGGRHQPIATSYSAGQGIDRRPRTKLPRKPNRMQAIQLKKRTGAGLSRKARNQAAIHQAAGSGNKFVFLDFGRRQGIFRVTGGKRNPKIRMVWDLSRTAVRIPRNPWLEPATRETRRQIPRFYADALRFQLQRRKIFGYT